MFRLVDGKSITVILEPQTLEEGGSGDIGGFDVLREQKKKKNPTKVEVGRGIIQLFLLMTKHTQIFYGST